mgnify:CR=1 FL=1
MNDRSNEPILVALSGGVDSAVSAALLKAQGYDVSGVYVRTWEHEEDILGECPGAKDLKDARSVAEVIGIPFSVVNFIDFYQNEVVMPMVSGYEQGITPNPDILCNRAMKFGAQKIMLHAQDEDRSPLGHAPTPGSADICLLSKTPVEDWAERFNRTGIRVEMGPVERRGATGPLKTIYIRDPDGNLIEISNRIAFKPPAVDLPPSIPSNATISNSE